MQAWPIASSWIMSVQVLSTVLLVWDVWVLYEFWGLILLYIKVYNFFLSLYGLSLCSWLLPLLCRVYYFRVTLFVYFASAACALRPQAEVMQGLLCFLHSFVASHPAFNPWLCLVITCVIWEYNNVHIHPSANQYPVFPASFIEGLCCPLETREGFCYSIKFTCWLNERWMRNMLCTSSQSVFLEIHE
jgi:hypothetical protein